MSEQRLKSAGMTSLPFTAAVCTLDRAEDVRRCIGSLLVQSAGAHAFEVLIVDNGPSASVAQVAREFADSGLEVRYVVESRRGLTYARRRAWKEARGDFVGYLDDDAIAHPDWVVAALQAFDEGGCSTAMVGGPVHDVVRVTEPWPFTDSPGLNGLDLGPNPRALAPQENLWGGNFVLRRQVLVELDAFGEPLGHRDGHPGANEDIIVQRQVDRLGQVRLYAPNVQVVHHSKRSSATESQRRRLAFYAGLDDAMMARLLGANSWTERSRASVARLKRLRAQLAAQHVLRRRGEIAEAARARRAAIRSLGDVCGQVWPLGKPASKPQD